MAPAKTPEEKAFSKAITDLAKLGITTEEGIEGFPQLTGEETIEQLTDMIVAAKAATKPSAPAKTSRSFTLKSGQVRTFCPADHGDTWEASADEFAETHKANIIKSE